MPRPIPPKQLEALLALDDVKKRYAYCVKAIADGGTLWLLGQGEGRCLLGPDASGHTLLPLWPHPDFAAAYLQRDPVAAQHWTGAKPIEIDVHDFLTAHIPRLTTKHFLIAAFPVPPGRACVVTPQEFAANLQHELDQVE